MLGTLAWLPIIYRVKPKLPSMGLKVIWDQAHLDCLSFLPNCLLLSDFFSRCLLSQSSSILFSSLYTSTLGFLFYIINTWLNLKKLLWIPHRITEGNRKHTKSSVFLSFWHSGFIYASPTSFFFFFFAEVFKSNQDSALLEYASSEVGHFHTQQQCYYET